MHPISWTIIAVVLVLNVVATARIRDNENLSPSMRHWQWLLVWLLPVCGAVVTLIARLTLDVDAQDAPAGDERGEADSEFMSYAQTTSTAEIADIGSGD
ncbi:hypothetical protein J5226_02905 [Lysobacter sp. K5869]|uniref:hypothetical protein n=1 Tax=Lysobacter sp. K5869 TaxID=2820808 RepID=UPI001C060BB9|nr:hypothetical protein [Lysobacter sp. K5869]QWP77372.1 hypothetical protein J5226_02905 [Lysobacter sp. K5869]